MTETQKDEVPKKQYMVWIEVNDDSITMPGYFEMFDTIESAVSSHGSSVEIYRADIKPIGKYRKQTKFVKIKTRRKKAKRL